MSTADRIDELCLGLVKASADHLRFDVNGYALMRLARKRLGIAKGNDTPKLSAIRQLIIVHMLMELFHEVADVQEIVAGVIRGLLDDQLPDAAELSRPKTRQEELRRLLVRGLLNSVSIEGTSLQLGKTVFVSEDDPLTDEEVEARRSLL